MSDPVDLDAKRKEKKSRCAICGGPSHDFSCQCPRICAITEEVDGSITYHLNPIDEPPRAA
jgi:hypothetical protein